MCKLTGRSLTSHIKEPEKHTAKWTQSRQKELLKITAVTKSGIKSQQRINDKIKLVFQNTNKISKPSGSLTKAGNLQAPQSENKWRDIIIKFTKVFKMKNLGDYR